MHNENKSRQTQQSSSEVTNLNLQDTSGVTLGMSHGNTIISTDQGAIDGAVDIALEGLMTAAEDARGSRELVGRIGESALNFADNAFGDAIGAVDRSGERLADVALESTDQALGFGLDALDAVGAASSRFADVALESLSEALSFGDDQNERVAEASANALDFGGGVLSEAQEFTRGIFSDALDATQAVLAQGQQQLGETVTSLNAIARENSTSADQRVQSMAEKTLIAAAVIVGLMMLSKV